MIRPLLLVCCMALAACAANSGVVEIGPDTYLVSRQAATGFSGRGTLKADAIREAAVYCARLGKKINVLHTEEARPPYVLGNFPKAEIQFTCLTPAGQPLR